MKDVSTSELWDQPARRLKERRIVARVVPSQIDSRILSLRDVEGSAGPFIRELSKALRELSRPGGYVEIILREVPE